MSHTQTATTPFETLFNGNANLTDPTVRAARANTPVATLTAPASKGDQLATGTYDNTTACVYDGRPAISARAGQNGNRFGLCGDCAPSHDASLTAEELAGETAREHHEPRTVNVKIGQNLSTDGEPVDVWPLTDTPDFGYGYGYAFEAVYDPARVSLSEAEDLVRTRLAGQGVTVTGFLNGDPAPCHLYPGLCNTIDGEDGDAVDADGRHFDHGGSCCFVPGLEIEGDPEIWAEFTHISDSTPRLGFMGHDLTPDQAHEKATQIRQFADDLDRLADQVATARALYNLREVRKTADAPFAKVLTIMEDAIVRQGADPVEVGDRVLGLLRQAMAEKSDATAATTANRIGLAQA